MPNSWMINSNLGIGLKSKIMNKKNHLIQSYKKELEKFKQARILGGGHDCYCVCACNCECSLYPEDSVFIGNTASYLGSSNGLYLEAVIPE